MADVSWLSAAESASFFGHDSHHVPVNLNRLKNARVLWLNQKAVTSDPHFDRVGQSMSRYEQHILSACAHAILTDSDTGEMFDDDVTVGYADRYGGSGIGLNGGSGRAAVVNGYLVKGVGRTPLVSSLTDESHASGGAYLEESIRETIFAEIVRAEFPCSAIPVLAIIDTGLIQIFEESAGPKMERRTLLIRPSFIRPAHFERATAYFSGNPKEGQQDTLRVSQFFTQAIATFGQQELTRQYKSLWLNWAQQLAYSFVHRLPHGSNTISNICLDGKLLDFGAMSAVPSWANAATMLSRQTFGMQFNVLPRMIRLTGYFFSRYLNVQIGSEESTADLTAAVQSEYRRTILVETLRLCGVLRDDAEAAANGPDFSLLWQSIVIVIEYFQKERIDLVERTPVVNLQWDLHAVWKKEPPVHLGALQILLKSLVSLDDQAVAAKRCCLLSATRENLFREEAKCDIFSTLDGSHRGEEPNMNQIEQFINEQVVEGRRDHQFAVHDAAPIGFAINIAASYVLFKEKNSDKIFGITESDLINRNANKNSGIKVNSVKRLAIQHFSATSLQFQDRNTPPFKGAVKIYCDKYPT